MKTMKKLFMATMAAALIGMVLSCPNPAGSGGKSKTDPNGETKTAIVFDNTRGQCAVSVYSYGTRTDEYKIAEVGAGSSSDPIEWAASPDGYTFYLTYLIPLGDDIVIPHIPSPPLNAITVRVDKGKTTSATIGSLVPSPALITDNVYLLLYNDGGNSSAFQLEERGRIIRPEKVFDAEGKSAGDSSLVNPGERAWYIVAPGSAAGYHISLSGAAIPFSGITDFQAGRLYIAHYTSGGLNVDAEQELSLEWLLGRSRVVTFDADGGNPATQTRTVTDGASLGEDMPPEPAKTDYVFDGWYTAPDGVGTEFTATTAVSADMTVYARWSVVRYTVTFDADGGSPATQTKPANDLGIVGTSNMPQEPARINYTFGGWYTERNGGGTKFYVDMPITGNVTMYAKWTLGQCTVTFDADGGSPTGEQRRVNSGAYVGTPNMPSAPAKSGSIFGGWYTKRNGGGSQFYVDTIVTDNITVYAKWTLDSGIQYTITFNTDGGSPTPAPLAVSSGGTAGSNMPTDPARSGYVFGGWYTDKNGEGTRFTSETTVLGNIIVYARWTYQYTVTFDADGGSPVPASITVLGGNSVGVSNMPADPAKSGYTFGGWYTAQNNGGTEFTGLTPVNGNMTVYAKWTIIQYTVTFDADGGSPAPASITVLGGNSVGVSNMPADPAKSGYTFGGWYTAINGGGTQFTASTVVSGNMTVYAKWTTLYINDALSLNDALTWISANATEGGAYTITLTSDETIAPKTLYYSRKNVSVTIKGDAAKRTIDLSSKGVLFTVASGVTLTLDNNIVLRGRSDNNYSLVSVDGRGKLVMNTGSEISGNSASSYGGGVYVQGGTFTMNGGTISGNSASSYGGGVYVQSGTFTMNGGTISGNSAAASSSYRSGGGGVYVDRGTFTMSGGEISGNTAPGGGGVYLYHGTFTLNDGTISGNPASSAGGGVCMYNGTFTMGGGTISDNTASAGAGVFVSNIFDTFTMNGGTISGNTASSGGGVSVSSGTFTMSNGTISGNTASSGGGVYVGNSVTGTSFTMSGGTISGNTASSGGGVYVYGGTFTKQSGGIIYGVDANALLRNTATNGDDYGHAVYNYAAGGKKRNTTAGVGVTLDSSAGGWE